MVSKLNHLVIVITFMLAQSDYIKRQTLYLNGPKSALVLIRTNEEMDLIPFFR